MKYTENDIKAGTKLRCTKSTPERWTVGKVYDVTLNEYYNRLQILDNEGYWVFTDYMLDGLNGNRNTVSFEIVEEEKEMTKYVEVTKLIDWSRDPQLLEVGKVYKVDVEYKESLYIKGVSIYVNENEPSYYLRSDQFKYVEQNEEEKEMTNYVEITKLMECTPDEKVIEIGKKYKVLYPTLSGVYIYASKANQKYFIYNNQFKYSFESNKEEKEVPTLEAKADVKEVIQAKIDALTTEAERLFTKRDRLEQHAINLNAKARKLEEVLETIKEFE